MTLQLLDPSLPADPRDPMWGSLPWPEKYANSIRIS